MHISIQSKFLAIGISGATSSDVVFRSIAIVVGSAVCSAHIIRGTVRVSIVNAAETLLVERVWGLGMNSQEEEAKQGEGGEKAWLRKEGLEWKGV